MKSLKDLIQDEPVHQRHLEFRSYPLENERIIVEGRLRDDRLVQGYHWDGTPIPAGVVHNIRVRMLVGGMPPTILDAEAEMLNVPHELCPTTLDSVKKIIGLSIAHGYSEEVHKRMGGVKGCAHLTHLIVTMGTAAIHGRFAQHTRRPRPLPRSLDDMPQLSTVVRSCKLWDEDGPLLRRILEAIEKSNETDTGP
jgi:hypothetical protein